MKFQTVLASAGRRDHPLLPPLGVVGTMGPIAAPPRAAGSVSSGAGAGEEVLDSLPSGIGGGSFLIGTWVSLKGRSLCLVG